MGLFSNDRNTRPFEQEQTPAPEPARRPPRRADDNYGIDKAIKLMRTLPVGDENVEIVVQVIKNTLESINVQVSSIIDDATRKQDSINGQVDKLEAEVKALEAEIADRQGTIEGLRADYAETTKVKEHLILSEELSQQERAEAAAQQEARAEDGAKPEQEASRDDSNADSSQYHLV